jgi:hypothetical protein
MLRSTDMIGFAWLSPSYACYANTVVVRGSPWVVKSATS